MYVPHLFKDAFDFEEGRKCPRSVDLSNVNVRTSVREFLFLSWYDRVLEDPFASEPLRCSLEHGQ